MPHVYHLLSESEPFSEHNGGAVSRWVANVTRWDSDTTVIAPSSDGSWGFDPAWICNLPGLVGYKNFMEKGGHYLPWVIRLAMLRRIIQPALKALRPKDTVWIHGRPEFAAALEPFVHERGARLFLHLHNSHLVNWSTRVTRAIHADCYVFCSRFLQDEALAKFPSLGRSEVLVNGANQEMFRPSTQEKLPEQEPTVLFAGRLVPDKGLHIFLDAMRTLVRQGVPLRGLVVGGSGFGSSVPTPYIREMRATAPANVRFEPYCSGNAMAEKFREADIYCLPSCWNDPFPLTVLEAMASEVPVVASRSGGIPEQLADGGGVLIARNSAPELAVALIRLALDPKMRRELGTRGLTSFRKNFTWESVHATYRRILEPEVTLQGPVESSQYVS